MNPTLTAAKTKPNQNLTPTERNLRRRLIFQDSLALLSLTLIAICIAIVTYFFFQSFQQHRRVLEKRWFARGEKALASGHPGAAVEDFRSALSLSTANPGYEMALAEALAADGRTEEAYVYFSSLHDAQPGDGFLNLQLARLAVQRKNPAQAIGFYQSALNGLWYGEGTERRLQIRLELARYLLSLGRITDAQGQLLAAEGNSLDQPSALLEIANLLMQAHDPSDAWTAYQRVEQHPGASASQALKSLEAEAQVAESMGLYKRAAEALERYNARERQHPKAATPEEKQTVQLQLSRLHRMLQLIPFYALPPEQHAERVLHAASIAHQRYVECSAKLQSPNGASRNVASQNVPAQNPSKPGLFAKGLSTLGLFRQRLRKPAIVEPSLATNDSADLAQLGTQWTPLSQLEPANLAGNAPLEQRLVAWTNQTEIVTAKLCGPPTGDDALLLQLAQTPDKTE